MAGKITRSEHLSAQLKKVMADRGIGTVYALFKLTGIPQPVLHRYVNGEAKQPDAFVLVRLAEALGVGVDYLLGTGDSDVEVSPTELVMVEV